MMRIGDNFVDIPTSVLRSLFYPHRNSYVVMKIKTRIENAEDMRGQLYRVNFLPSIQNKGPATLEDLFVVMKPLDPLYLNIPNSWVGGRTSAGWDIKYPDPIHPGQSIGFCPAVRDFRLLSSGYPNFEKFTANFEFQMYARDQVPFRISIAFSENDFIASEVIKEGFSMPIDLERYGSTR